jgi:DNA-binding transcriptional LysR family regulator
MALFPGGHSLAARKDIAFEELLEFEHIGIAVTSALSVQLAEQASRLNRSIRHAYRTATYDVARMMVAQGCGVAILPSCLVLPHVSDRLVAVPLSDIWARRNTRLCYRKEAALTVAARLFIEHLLEHASQ